MNLAKKISCMAMILLVVSLYGCGDSVQDQVSADIERELSNRFRGFLVDPKVEITAFESNDSSVAPEYKSRFVATMRFFEPTYEKVSSLRTGDDEWTVLREKYPEGGKFSIYGNSTSKLRNELLVTELSGINGGDQVAGVRFNEVPYGLVEGSNAHKSVVDEVKRIEEVKQKKLAEVRKQFVGQWKGTYTCVDFDGWSKLKDVHYDFGMHVSAVSNDPRGFAVMTVGFADEQKPRAHEYVLEGRINEDGTFDINPVTWVHRVGSQDWAGFKGSFDASSDELSGDVKYRDCKNFKLKRST